MAEEESNAEGYGFAATMKKTRKEKDSSFAVGEVGGGPPMWVDEDEVNQVNGQRKLFTICGGHPCGRMSCQAIGESGSSMR